jgi:DNA repair protein RecN (Recombination protein N)
MYDLRHYVSKIDADPSQLESLQQRLSDLRKLQKKYGPSVNEILQALIGIESEIGNLQNSEWRLSELNAQAEKLEKELQKIALEMHKKRQTGSHLLKDSVNAELLDLNMKGVTFQVATEKLTALNSSGVTAVEFMSQTSPADPPRPLAKFASGGELSRILLALKRVVGSSNQPRTYLFDEVDTGVSGPTAEKVGKKLRSIAKGQQVICVTHLPQVAACGDAHFFIQKSPQKGAVAMEVLDLNKEQRVREIARLISGEKITKTSLAHAQELLK